MYLALFHRFKLPFPISGGCVNYSERGGSCLGRLRQHVCAQQLQTRAPRSKTGPLGRNTILPGTRYYKQEQNTQTLSPSFLCLPHFLSLCSAPLPSLPPLSGSALNPSLSPLKPALLLSFLSLPCFLPDSHFPLLWSF